MIGVDLLAGHLQPEVVEAAESGQVSAGEARSTGSVGHVEVFRMRRVGTFIFERPRPLSRQRRADDLYTLNCEEPVCPHRQRAFGLRGKGLVAVLKIGRNFLDLSGTDSILTTLNSATSIFL